MAERSRFAIPGKVDVGTGEGALACVRLTSAASTATLYLHGAQLTSFAWNGEPPLLFLSERARFGADRAIRGGVPIVFPWFGDRDGLPAHGFARTSEWSLAGSRAGADGAVSVTLALEQAPAAIAWPPFAVHATVTISDRLVIELAIENRDRERSVRVEHCLHSYFAVGDVDAVAIAGLRGLSYVDKTDGFARKVDREPRLRIAGETDRVYAARGVLAVDDPVLGRRIRIESEGTSSAVVWNPWRRALSDLGPEDYRRFVCVESGNVGDGAVSLAPGGRWRSVVAYAREPLATTGTG